MTKPNGNKASGRRIARLCLGDIAHPGSDGHRVDADLACEVSDREPRLLELADEVMDLGLGPAPAGRCMGWTR